MKKTPNGYSIDGVTIVRTQNGFTVKNTQKETKEFKLLRDARRFIASNWSIALIEAQFAK